MTAHNDLDRQLNDFLREGPEELPYQSFDAVRDLTEQTRQRVVIGPWRLSEMNKFVTIGLGAAAVVILVVVGAQLFGAPSGGVGSGISPTAEPIAIEDYIGEYASDDGLIMRIYPAGDPVCEDLDLSTECWSLGRAATPLDGAQGSARIEDGRLALLNTRCPNCIEEEVGATNFWELREGGRILYGLECEPEGVSCPDEGHSYERQEGA
jgi:hypothetical protein